MKAVKMISGILACALLLSACKDSGGSSSPESSAPAESTGGEVVQEEESLWDYGQVAFGGGGFVTGVFSTCEKGVYYARTDVGGAYRWSESEKKWKNLNYWVSEEDKGLMGIDGLAADPNDASKVYILAGTNYFSNGKTCLLKSSDYGAHFEVIELTSMITAHGNGMGRGNGERIAVDPADPQTLFIGGRTGGLIKSTDGGATWESVSSFPVQTTANANGINCVLFDPASAKDGKTQRIYVSVSQKNADNIYVTEDGGATWAPLAGADTSLMPQRMKLTADGTLYVTYGSEEGPHNQQTGALYRYKDGSAENIAPDTTPFGDIVFDPQNPDRMVLVTTQTWSQQPCGAYGDIFYTTTDGGKTWTNILPKMTMTTGGMDWIDGCAMHWCSSLAIDPFDPNRVMVNSGNGVFSCDNIWNENPEFYFDAYGIEELVPLDIVSIEGDALYVAALDYDGYISEDVTKPAQRFSDRIGSTSSVTVAAQNTDYIAKVGYSTDAMALSVSTDGGSTWKTLKKSPEKGKKLGGGHVAFNADGSRLLWSPENGTSVYYTEDLGETWNVCEGVLGTAHILGDPSDPEHVYALSGSVYASADGGRTFEKVNGIQSPSGKRLCVDPHNPGTFYVPDMLSLYKVTDYGATVTTVDSVRGCEVMALGKSKAEGGPLAMYVYGYVAGGDGKQIYMSSDDGATWQPVTDALHQFGGTGNGAFIGADMNVYGRCYMSTVGLGVVYCDLKDKS